MTKRRLLLVPFLVAAVLAGPAPVQATDAAVPAASAKQAKYLLHVDGMT